MNDGNPAAPTAANDRAPVFRARLEPYRSLSHKGLTILLGVFGTGCFAAGVAFWAAGAWPVMGFLGLDIVALWAAFVLNNRSARAFEEVAVWPHDLLVRQVSAGGKVYEHRFNPFWTRFEVRRHEESGITSMGLSGQGREVRIGAFLNPADRESFASAFAQALARAKRG